MSNSHRDPFNPAKSTPPTLLDESALRRALDVIPEAHRNPLTGLDATDRPCGGCSACCHVMPIYALQKPSYETCGYTCAAGCAIYDTKPQECNDYYCAYRLGFLTGGEEMRPDKFGLFVDFRPVLNREGKPIPGEDLITAWEVRPDVAVSERGFTFLKRLVYLCAVKGGTMTVALVPYGAPKMDAHRTTFVTLFTAGGSTMPDGVFNCLTGSRAYAELSWQVANLVEKRGAGYVDSGPAPV